MSDTPSLFDQPKPNCECGHDIDGHIDGRCTYPDCLCGADPTDPHAYIQRDPRGTSIDAARSVLPRSGTQRWHVLVAITARPRTDDELMQLPNTGVKAGVRRQELVERGWVRDSGEKRLTRNKCRAIVWELTPEGRKELDRRA